MISGVRGREGSSNAQNPLVHDVATPERSGLEWRRAGIESNGQVEKWVANAMMWRKNF